MKQTVIAIGLFYIFTSCKTEADLFTVDNSKIGVTYKRARGTIFNDNYPFSNFHVSDVDAKRRWTPNKEDIELAEHILRQNIKETNKTRFNQVNSCPVIHRHLEDYFRQYVGIINDQGQRLIHINFYWDKFGLVERIKGYNDNRLDFESDYAFVFDGCSYYWKINVNLDEKRLSDMSVNGVARMNNIPQQHARAVAGLNLIL